MTLQAKLTLSTVLLAAVIVAFISGFDLANIMQLEFEHTLMRAEFVKQIAIGDVKEALNSQPDVPPAEILGGKRLADHLNTVVTYSKELVEVVVVDADNRIVADSLPGHLGQYSPRHADFTPVVTQIGALGKLRVLTQPDTRYYQLEQELGPSPNLFVRVIVRPSLIHDYIRPVLGRSRDFALASLVGAICLTFLFSALAFRPLGRLRRQLDLLASGDYDPARAATAKSAGDEFSVIASQVNLLGQRLRGAQDEVSDLRGNIDRVLQDLEDAVFIFNREKRLVFASGSVDKFLQCERTGLPGQLIGDIFPPSTNLGFLVAQVSETGTPIQNRRIPLDTTGASKNGGSSVLLSVNLLETQPGSTHRGAGMLVRLRDPEAQRKIGRQLQTADRLAAISRVSGGVAHEVKNPLNAILLHVEVARTRLARGETDITPQMDIISREILRLDRVVKTFLDFTRPVELNYKTVALQDLIKELVELARPQADAGKIRMIVDVAPDGVPVGPATPFAAGAQVRVDSDLFKQALLNVVVNAMQAMPQGGELRFESSVANDVAEIRISDTGTGIPPELRDKIFRLYFTTKAGGSGIGLAMTFRIVQLHDGTIDFSSEPGKGTTFVIRLPIAV
ncbi:MAG TPA: ATP-binding protein [Bryobacteraceae bacterium]|nr:ATP-binding protein [Bryobacteraceae bacterium]